MLYNIHINISKKEDLYMEISKKDIYCKEITERIERLSIQIRKFIQLVNRQVPEEFQLGNECFFIEKEDDKYSFLDDGRTRCPGFSYRIFWAYTFGKAKQSKKCIANLKQEKAVIFEMKWGERCFDHRENGLYFFSLYFKGDKSDNKAEEIDDINDNYRENYLFQPFTLVQVVWRIKQLNILPSNITENGKKFEEFAKTLEAEKFSFRPDIKYKLVEKGFPKEISRNVRKFKKLIHRFVCTVNSYVAVDTQKVEIKDLKEYFRGKSTPALQKAMEEFTGKSINVIKKREVKPKTFLCMEDSHTWEDRNEKLNSFYLKKSFKVICGYSYFNEFVFPEGITDNWYPRLLYFSYYISSDLQKTYYTISMTSYECGMCMKLIEASTIDELLSTENAIKVGKWLEEVWEKTALTNYYSSLIENEKITNFSSTLDRKQIN